jgi:hypothetical protein
MLRRTVLTLFTAVALCAGRVEAVTIRDLIELSKAGLSDPVLLALIEVDRSVFSIDTATLKQLKEAGVSDQVIVALIRSGRQPRPEPVAAPAPEPLPREREPEVIVIDHRDSPAPAPPPAPVAYPIAYPVYVPVPSRRGFDTRDTRHTIETTFPTDAGLVRARVPVPPNCVKAEPVYWGFGGKLRPGSWEPPPTVVCR